MLAWRLDEAGRVVAVLAAQGLVPQEAFVDLRGTRLIDLLGVRPDPGEVTRHRVLAGGTSHVLDTWLLPDGGDRAGIAAVSAMVSADAARLATIEHEVRGPLHVAAGLGAILREEHAQGLSDDARDVLDALLRAVDRADALVRSIATGSMSEGSPGPVGLGDALATACAEIEDEIASHGAEVTAGPLPAVAVDEIRVTQVLRNLIANAVVHNAGRHLTVRVSARRRADVVDVAVADDGVGIPPDELEQIFERGVRGSRHGPGSGLGLDVCRSVVGGWGGRIWAERRRHGGAVVHFTAPAAPAAAVPTRDH